MLRKKEIIRFCLLTILVRTAYPIALMKPAGENGRGRSFGTANRSNGALSPKKNHAFGAMSAVRSDVLLTYASTLLFPSSGQKSWYPRCVKNRSSARGDVLCERSCERFTSKNTTGRARSISFVPPPQYFILHTFHIHFNEVRMCDFVIKRHHQNITACH